MPREATTEPTHPPGLDLHRLELWWRTGIGPADPLSARLLTGGKSNLTYEITDGITTWVLRRPPLGHVLDTAHDMRREYRVMNALRDTPVPVPATYALNDDASLIGAPFYVMERVAGRSYRHAGELKALGADRTRALALRLIETLAALHSVDPASVGLGDFGRPTGYLPRQLARWHKQMAASKTPELPAARELHGRLAAAIPAERPPTIVHGDYRLDNVLFDAANGRPTAVLDWEMATLGDPLADLALMLMYGRLALLPAGGIVSDVSRAPGYPSEYEIVERYAAQSGRDVARLGFYLGLSAYKLVAIIEGIRRRHARGDTVGPGFDGLGDAVDGLLDAGLTAIQELA
jgi:aminoglycoside phosphotransferase (APT) family kinase protein